MDAKTVIADVLDEFDVEEFVDESFNDTCAHKIISQLEWHGFKIVKMVRREAKPMELPAE